MPTAWGTVANREAMRRRLVPLIILIIPVDLSATTIWGDEGRIPISASSVALNPSCAAPAFAPQVIVSVGQSPTSIAVADLDGDALLDMAVTNLLDDTVSILLGDGSGSFGPRTTFEVGNGPNSIIIADFNGDEKRDLTVANEFAGTVSILLGDGSGGFAPQTTVAVGNVPASMAGGDFNTDGRPDLAVPNFFDATITVLLGNGDGSFGSPTTFPVGRQPISAAVGDFDRDTRVDLAVANDYDATVSILLGDGDGSFSPQAIVNIPGGNDLRTLAATDFSDDGDLDLVVVNAFIDSVVILLGNGDGSFGAPNIFPVGGQPIRVAVGDLNGDEQVDLAVGNADDANVSILLGNGDGTFGPQARFPAGSGAFPVALGDLNSDGGPDLVVGNFFDNTASILLNLCVPQVQPPVALCQDVVVSADADCLASADVDDGSFDLDGDPITLAQSPPGPYGLGSTLVILTVTDEAGALDSCAATVTVVDNTPPGLSVTLIPDTLWPPNHRMVTVEALVSAADACGPSIVLLYSVASSELDDAPGSGDGNTTEDIQNVSIGTPDTMVLLRAEREGDGPGRTYTLTYAATDASGNTSSALGLVTVPHDLGTGAEPVMMSAEGDGTPGMAHVYWNGVAGAEMCDLIQGDLDRITTHSGIL